jgi:hypothetical protein
MLRYRPQHTSGKRTRNENEKGNGHTDDSTRSLGDMLVDTKQTYRWLKFGDIKGETESLIVVAQDQALGINYFKNKILISVPSDRNVTHKEAEKKLKYKNLCIEIQRMWNMKCSVMSVVIGAIGTVIRGLRKYLEEIPGKHYIDSLKKKITAILGTLHVLRKVRQSEA